MPLLPMHAPAELHKCVSAGAPDVIVARGPLVIMAHGLLALPPADRSTCWISSTAGDLTPNQAEAVLRAWSRRH